MKQVYQSIDGKIFITEAECIKHEKEIALAQQNQKLFNDIKVVLNEVNTMVDQFKTKTGLAPKYAIDQGRLIIYFEERKNH